MKETLNLTKILLKSSFNKNLQEQSSKKSKISMTIFVSLAIIYVIGVLGYLCYETINTLKSINQEQVFLSICLIASIGVTFFRTILTSLNVLYFSKDIEFLLPLPIKPIKIVLAKFNVMLVSEYITELITFVVPFAIYGYVTGANFIFYIHSLLVFLFLPIIPMLISIGIIVIIMKFTKFLNNKDIVQYLSVFLTIALVIGIQFINTSSNNQVTNFMIANKLIEINGLVDVFSQYFFTLRQGIDAIIKPGIEGLINILFLAIESILAYITVAYLVSKIYIQSAIEATFSGIKSKKRKKNKFNKQSIGISYIKKEFKTLFRNPVFFLQCVLPSILFPFIFSIPLYKTISDSGEEQIEAIKQAILEVSQNSMGIGIILLIINFMYMFNFISVTAISRDGENSIFMKYIPIDLHKQCKYKIVPSIALNMVPLIYVIGIIKLFVPEILWLTIIELFVIGLVCNIVISYLSILIDLVRPKLHWTSEYSVVKQNMNMLYDAILIFFVMGVIMIVCAYFDNLHVVTGILLGIASIVLIIYEMFLRKYSCQIFRKIC